jgi:hypothetical protein
VTIADTAYWMDFTRDLFAALTILVGAVLAFTLYAKLRAGFRLRVIDKWVGDRLILRFEIENTSAVYVDVDSAYAEVQAKPLTAGGWLPNQVEFAKTPETAIFSRATEATNRILPSEVMAAERIHDFPAEGAVVQVGFRVAVGGRGLLFPQHVQATTVYFVKPAA